MSTLRPSLAFASCAVILAASLGFAFYRRHCDVDTDPVAIVAPLPVFEPEQPPVVLDAPLVTTAASAIERVRVSDTESLQRIADLEAENEKLRERIRQLEACRPTTEGELAVLAGVDPQKLKSMIDRRMFPDAGVLAETIKSIGWEATWNAIKLTYDTHWALIHWRTASKEPEPGTPERRTWHHSVWSPHLSASIATLCDQLYALRVPSTVVEPFRQRLEEGI